MTKILIVDDDPKWLSLFSSMISLMDFEVDVAERGDEALKYFPKRSFDLVFTDLNMPGIDGWLLAKHIKGMSPKTIIVLVTAGDRDPILEKLQKSSIDFVLFKPFGLEEFKETLQAVLEIS